MPFLFVKVNVSINHQQECVLKSALGKAIRAIPGKDENNLLLGFEDRYHFYLRGDPYQKVAYIEIKNFGTEDHLGYDQFASEVTAIFQKVLNIPPKNIYIHFTDIHTWCVHGILIDA